MLIWQLSDIEMQQLVRGDGTPPVVDPRYWVRLLCESLDLTSLRGCHIALWWQQRCMKYRGGYGQKPMDEIVIHALAHCETVQERVSLLRATKHLDRGPDAVLASIVGYTAANAPYRRWPEDLLDGVGEALEGLLTHVATLEIEPQMRRTLNEYVLEICTDVNHRLPDVRALLALTPEEVATALTELDRDRYCDHRPRFDAWAYGLLVAELPDEVVEPHIRCASSMHHASIILNSRLSHQLRMDTVERFRNNRSLWSVLAHVHGEFDADWVRERLMTMASGNFEGWAPDPQGIKAAYVVGEVNGLDIRDAAMRKRALDWFDRAGAFMTPTHHLERLPDQLLVRIANTSWRPARKGEFEPLAAPVMARIVRDHGSELDEDARVELARRGCPATLLSLLEDDSVRVRQHVARSRHADAEVLQAALRDPEPRVRTQVARARNVTDAILTEMSRDPRAAVRRAATRRLMAAM